MLSGILLCGVASQAAVFNLTINVTGSGSVSRNPTNSVYPSGSVVTITASPDPGWMFSGWGGDASGSVNPLNVAMTSDKIITANFQAIPSYALTVFTNGQGSIALDPPGGNYLSNTIVTATATPAAGWVFVNWAGDAGGSANPVSVTINANRTLTALFAQQPAIDAPPQNVASEAGATVVFAVHAVGQSPLSYQWWFNNLALLAATNTTLILTNIQLTQEGLYAIVVSNAYGTTSNAATLAITNSCSGTNVVSDPTEASLRAAINAGGLVRICCNGTITLSNTIDITHDVALDARNRNVIISGNNAVRLFNVTTGVTFSVTNLTLANGRHIGKNGADALGNFRGPENGFPGEGGAVLNNGGTVILVSSILTNNFVVGGMGGMGNTWFGSGTAGEGRGGAICNRGGALLLYSVTVCSNLTVGGPGIPHISTIPPDLAGLALGGAVYSTNGMSVFLSSLWSNNVSLSPAGGTGARARGGAIFLASGSIFISNNTLAANQAMGEHSFGSQSGHPSSAYGGAIAADLGTMTINSSVLVSNIAQGGRGYHYSGDGEAQGGAIMSKAFLAVNDTSFSGNQALAGTYSYLNADGCGGAIYNAGTAVLNRCSLYWNHAEGSSASGYGLGGSVFNLAQFAATNCTLALNSARGGNGSFGGPGWPGALPGPGAGGGICNGGGALNLANVTIASNSVVAATSGYNTGWAAGDNVANTNGTFTLRNSLLAYGGTNGNAWGAITDAGYNMSSDGSASFNSGSSFNFTDPQLGPLANNGGPTFTMALLPNSPAIDFGDGTGSPPVDQRGIPRPFGAGWDIGACEQTDLPSLSITARPNSISLSFEALANKAYHLQTSGDLTTWTEIESFGPFLSATNISRTINHNGRPCIFFRLLLP